MEQFKKQLIEAFNNNELPFDAKFYVLKDVYRDLFELYERLLKEYEIAAAKESEDAEILKKNEAKQITEIKEVK